MSVQTGPEVSYSTPTTGNHLSIRTRMHITLHSVLRRLCPCLTEPGCEQENSGSLPAEQDLFVAEVCLFCSWPLGTIGNGTPKNPLAPAMPAHQQPPIFPQLEIAYSKVYPMLGLNHTKAVTRKVPNLVCKFLCRFASCERN